MNATPLCQNSVSPGSFRDARNPVGAARPATASRLTRLLPALWLGLLAVSGHAQTVLVEARSGGQNNAWSTVINAAPAGTWGNSTAKSSAAGVTAGVGSSYFTQNATVDQSISPAMWQITPTLPTPGGTYRIEITHPSATASTTLVVSNSVIGGSGLPETSAIFQAAGGNTWEILGTVTLDEGVTQPTITFEYFSGTVSTSSRWYADAIRFVDLTPVVPRVWTGGGADDNWSTAANWTNNTAPAAINNALQFGGTTRPTPVMDSSYSVLSIDFDATAGAFSLTRATTNDTLAVTDVAGIKNSSTNMQTLNQPVTMSGTAGTVDTGTGGITISAVLSGTVGLSKVGAGTLILSGAGANNYSGPTVVNAGTVQLSKSSGNALPNSAITIKNGGTIRNTVNNRIHDTPIMTLENGGTYDLNGHTETVDSIQTASTSPGAVVSIGSGNLIVKPSATGGYNLNTGISGNYGRITGSTGSRLTKNGTGEFRIHNATNSFEQLIINDGTLQAGNLTGNNFETIFGAVPAALKTNAILMNGGRIGASFAVTLHTNRGVTLSTNGGWFRTDSGTMTIPGPITGIGHLGKTNTGTLILTGTNDYTGGTTVTAGILQGNTRGLQGPITNDAAVTFNQGFTGTYAGDMTGSGTVTKSGTGTVILTGDNTYAGGTTINNGRLIVNNSTGSGAVTVNNNGTLGGGGTVAGAVTINAGGTIAAGTSAGKLTLQSGLDLATGTNVWELAALKDDSDGVAGTDFDQVALTGGSLSLGAGSVIDIRFIDAASAPLSSNPFWQAPRTWTVVAIQDFAFNGAAGFGSIVNGSYPAGDFATSVDGSGNVLLTFTPNATPPQPVIDPAIVGGGTANAQLSWSSVNGVNYVVEYKTNITQTGWLTLTNLQASGSITTIVDTTGPHQQRYYRVVAQ